jgi:hypothetical protein
VRVLRLLDPRGQSVVGVRFVAAFQNFKEEPFYFAHSAGQVREGAHALGVLLLPIWGTCVLLPLIHPPRISHLLSCRCFDVSGKEKGRTCWVVVVVVVVNCTGVLTAEGSMFKSSVR